MTYINRQLEFKEFSIEVVNFLPETIYSVKTVSTSTGIELAYRQKVVVRDGRDLLGEFVYLPTHRYVIQIYEKKIWHKKLNKIGVRRPHHRYIYNLSKRMMSAAHNPKSRRPVTKWKKRYELNLKPYIRFQKTEVCHCVYVRMSVRVAYTPQNSYTLEFAYDPKTDYLKRLSVKPETNFKDMGLKQFQVNSLSDQARRKAVYVWKQYLTLQLFNDPA